MHDGDMASTPTEYWERRREISPSPERPVVADGDRQLALVVELGDAGVHAAYERLQDRLGRFDCLRATPAGELHLTVKLFDHALDALDGDAAPVRVDDIDTAVTELLADRERFEVGFPRLNLFPDTVYAEVEADGMLSALNRALCDPAWAATSDRDREQFIPHLTLGYLTADEGFDRLVDYLERHRDPAFPTATVSELSLVAADGSSGWRSASTTLRTYSL